ncbi:MAG: 50S ribosomal protein L1 [Candidatus Dojkabacteria bacterium]|nr:50S ribosomal protein L1 [Candidatus Dojkabacteria bacterium]MDQ7021767.1 50S ribosomal protein L1 [Candidatus Dojkabacteria bacterium]
MENIKKEVSLEDAIKALKEGKKRNFNETVDIEIIINLKEKQKKESLKGSVTLPNKFGEDKKIIVFCDDVDVKAAKEAGAIEAGLADLEEKIMGGWSDFDVVITKPSIMPKIAKLGKVLGPKGLMPNPSNGTITDNFEDAIKSFIGGKMNYKMEQGHGIIRSKIAKVDMTDAQINENVVTLVQDVSNEAKRLSTNPIKRVILRTTMGAGSRVDFNAII